MNLRDKILKVTVPTKTLDVPEWGATITLRALTTRTRTELLDVIYTNEEAVRSFKEDQELDEAHREGVAKVDLLDQSMLHLIWCIVDTKTLKPIFTLADYDQIIDLPVMTMNRLYRELLNLEAGVAREDQKKS